MVLFSIKRLFVILALLALATVAFLFWYILKTEAILLNSTSLRKAVNQNLFNFSKNITAQTQAKNVTELPVNQNLFNQSEGRYPLILYWDYPWFDQSSGRPDGSKIANCEVTYNRSRIKEAAAIVFHFTIIGREDIPWKYYRNENQIFIFLSAETPTALQNEGRNLREFDGGFFNWTWTYRRDADVLASYGYRGNVINGLPKGKKAIDDVIASKSKLAIWLVSHCTYSDGARLRMKYANELRDHGLKFDGFGKCFGNSPELPKEKTFQEIKKYKFYFAFENVLHCTDYITEKFWNNALGTSTVPVVWGPKKEDILSVAPLNSFISVEDFESPEKLAEYLIFLDSNDDEYRKYFRWREDESMTDEKMIKMTKEKFPNINVQEPPKNLCEKILENKGTKIIDSLVHEFVDKNPEECLGKP